MGEELAQLKELLKKFDKEEIARILAEIGFGEKPKYELLSISQMPPEKEETTRVIVFDKKIKRKLMIGEEEKLDEIAGKEGLPEPFEPSGTFTISGPTISSSTLASTIIRDFGQVCRGGGIYMSDSKYCLYPDSEIKSSERRYGRSSSVIENYFDCDDFAQVVAGIVNNVLKGIPFGVLWFRGPGVYHAVNCFYSMNQRKMKVVEPQTNRIYDFDKNRYCPMLVII